MQKFDPTGVGNPKPVFITKGVSVLGMRAVGAEGKHLKLKLGRDDRVFDAIAFNFGDYYKRLLSKEYVDIAYNIEENRWRNRRNLEINIRDIRFDTN